MTAQELLVSDVPAVQPRAASTSSIHAWLRWLFLIYSIPAVIFLSIAMGPFQVADEYAHLLRADQISRGGLSNAGLDVVDGSFIAFGHLYQSMWFHPEVKQTVALAAQSAAIPRSEPDKTENFQNTIQYGPFLYLPQVIGIWIGQIAGVAPPTSLLLARLINGLAACGVSFAALSICRRALPLTFTTLLFAMTLSQFASASQDALIISLSVFVVALASRSIEKGEPSVAAFAAFAAIVAATTLARPAEIALVLLAPAFIRWRDKALGAKAVFALIAAIVIGFWMQRLSVLMPPMPKDQSMAGQLHYIISEPMALPMAMLRTFRESGAWLLTTTVGRLGWLDTPMPSWYYPAAAVAFVCSLIVISNARPVLRPGLIAAVTLIASVTAISGALYMSWTPVGKPTIDGVQGRYILPVLPLLGWIVPAFGAPLAERLRPAWIPVLGFPLLTLAALPTVIMERYYGSWSVMAASLKALYLT